VDPACQDGEAVLRAAGGGHADALRRLLADGRANPSARRNAALRYVRNQYGAEPLRAALLADSRVAAAVAAGFGEEGGDGDGGEQEEDYVYSDGD